MEDGRPPVSRHPPRGRWARRLGLGLGGVVLLIALLPPLLLRGALLRRVVARATAGLCGTVSIEGGSVAWLVVPDLLLRRPIGIELDGLRVAGPDGAEVLALARVTADVAVARDPRRLAVAPVTASRGLWRLVVDRAGGAGGFLGAFRPLPAGGTRATCLAPAAAPRHGPRAPPNGGSLTLGDVRLEDIDVTLDFPSWGLSLPHVRGTGSLGVGAPAGTEFTFDVHDATAPGGALRVGPGGAAATTATTTAHFDDVAIGRVGIPPDRPDLVLTVAHADTGRSRLTGTAVFENVVAHHGRGGLRNPPGLALDARWERLADAAARLDAPWLPRQAMGELLDGALTAHVRGPFLALSGALSLEGPRVGIEATVEDGARATLEARTTDLPLAPFLHESLAPILGGTVTGRLRASAAFVGGVGDADLSISSADVTLTRDARAPRHLVFRVGEPPPGSPSPPAGGDALEVDLASARLFRRVLRLEGFRARWAELSARGALTLALPRGAAGTPSPPARIDARLAVEVPSVARWVPPETASARVSVDASLTGAFDHLKARLAFAPATTATILGERFRAPTPVTATLDDGRRLTITGLELARVGGGRLEAGGRVDLGGAVAGTLRVMSYPLVALPGLEAVRLPAALGSGGRARTLRDALAGSLDAVIQVAGSTFRPSFTGAIDLRGVALAERRIGDGHLRARARGQSLALDGTLGPSLALDLGATRRRDGVSGDVNLKLARFALGPWLPAPLSTLELAASGDARVAVAPRRPLAAHAALRITSPAGAVDLRGDAAGDAVEGTARGVLELAPLRALWERALTEANGAVTVDLAAAPGGRVRGSLLVSRALTLRPAGWPLALGVEEGGRVEIDGERLHVPGLALTAAGTRLALAGDARVDAARPERSTLALTATTRLDAAALAHEVKLPGLATASGSIAVDARATGELRAPDVTGTMRLDALELRPTSTTWPAVRVDGVVAASAHELTTRELRLTTVGPGAVTGAIVVGAADQAATVALATAWPPRVQRLDVPVAARGLRVGGARSSFSVDALDLALRLAGDPATSLALTGDVGIAGARFDPFAPAPKSAGGPARPWFEALPPWLSLDLTLHGPEDAIVVDVPVLPDLDLGLRCRVRGDARHGAITGELRGRGAYSRFMLALFGPKGARACQVLKE